MARQFGAFFLSLSLQVASNYVKQAQSDPWKNS